MGGPEHLGKGEIVWLPCVAKDGMFPTERYFQVSLPTVTVSGFIPSEDVRKEADTFQVRAVVTDRIDDNVALLFRGDLLSVTNPVTVPGAWLSLTATFQKGK